MSDPLTWPAAFMGVFTLINGSVLVPVVRGWARNREAGRKRDKALDGLHESFSALSQSVERSGERTESSIRELGAKLEALNQASWATKARVDVLETKVRYLEDELTRVRGAA